MHSFSRKDFTILLGNAVDHFDTSIYAFLAPVMAPLFFPHADPVVGLIMAYSIFITSIVTRPFGTYIFGMIARISGPARALSYSLIGVGSATFLMGALPEHSKIGVVAPVLLILLRIIREIFAAGESAIAKLYILQDKSQKEAFTNSYLYQISTICGISLASLAATLVHYLDTENSWRVIFFLGGLAAIIGYILRNNSDVKVEKDSEKILKFYNHSGIKILWRHKIDLLRIAIINSFSHLTYAIPFVTMNHLMPLISDIELKTMMLINSFMLLFDMLAIPLIGNFISRFKPNTIMFSASCVLALTVIPVWCFLEGASIIYVTFVRFWIIIWGVVFLCPLNLWCHNQVKGDEKYIVVGMGTTLGASIIGKMAPAACLLLYYKTGSHMSVALGLAIMFAIAALVLQKSR